MYQAGIGTKWRRNGILICRINLNREMEDITMPELTQHAALRTAQRNLSAEQLNYVMAHGRKFRQAGALIIYLRKRDIPEWDRPIDRWMRLAGTAVILTRDGRRIITVWRNRQKGLRRIKRKEKHILTEEQLGCRI